MRRDDDYVRELLLEAEGSDETCIVALLTLSPSPEDKKRYVHAQWLTDAGLFAPAGKGTFRITNQGHDYLASIRDDGIWAQTKAAAGKIGGGAGGVALGVMKEIATGYVRQELTRLGVPLSGDGST